MDALSRSFQLSAAMTQAQLPSSTPSAGPDQTQLRRAAQQFEGLLTQMMVKSMRSTSFGDDLMGKQGEHWMDMYDQQMSEHLASGKGLGVADMLVRQMQMAGTAPASGMSGGPIAIDRNAYRAASPAGAATGAAPTAAARSEPAGMEEVDAISGAAPDARAVADERLWRPRTPQEFVEKLKPYAEQAAAELGVPARALVAQAALETGWGRHLPRHSDGSSSFNLFGIKAHRGWDGSAINHQTTEFRNGSMQSERASFRAYGSVEDAFRDYVSFLKANPRYADALRAGQNGVQGFAQGLQKAGYATDPAYAQKLTRVAHGNAMNAAWGSAPRTQAV